jgi:LPXTG-site transpeptidase (sortase) family protein
MSGLLTPPEPVAWDSNQTAVALETTPSTDQSQSRRSFKTLAWICLCFIINRITITLGWPQLSPTNHSFDKISQHFWPLPIFYPGSRIGDSHRQYIYKTPLLLLLNFCFILIFVQATHAEPAASTTPTRLVIPSIGLDSVVVPVGWRNVEVDGQTYGQWEVNDNLVGWHNLSAPLGQAGNSVLNGHSNIYTRVFRNLDQIEIGDVIVAFADDQMYRYIVAAKILVQEKGVAVEKRLENAKLILPTEDERLTLITCARVGATHRFIVIALPNFRIDN